MSTPPSKILRNAARCLTCNDVIESRHRHEYVRCTCGNIAVDGGRVYLKRAFPALPPSDWLEDLSEYESEEELQCQN